MAFLAPLAEVAMAGGEAAGAGAAAAGGEAAASEGASMGETMGRAAEFQNGQKDQSNNQPRQQKGVDLTIGSLFGNNKTGW